MNDIRRDMRLRVRNIFTYLKMLRFIEQQGGANLVQARGGTAMPIDQDTIHVLKAGVFLHLYNLVESTVSSAMNRLAEEIKTTGISFADLDQRWCKAWAASFGNFDQDLAHDNRLVAAIKLCQAVVDGIALDIKPKFGVGNLDDRRIEDLAHRFGITLAIRAVVKGRVKRQVLNDQGFLGLIRVRRNDLAHGPASFADIGRDYSTPDLIGWSLGTYEYLKDVLDSFESYMSSQGYKRQVLAVGGP